MSPTSMLLILWLAVCFMWLWVYLDRAAETRGDFNIEAWRRCDTCDGKLTRLDGESLTPHIGHRLRVVHDGINPIEYLGILVGRI